MTANTTAPMSPSTRPDTRLGTSRRRRPGWEVAVLWSAVLAFIDPP
jgi:hypothetical protein